MKKIQCILCCIALFPMCTVFGQVKIVSTGKLVIGNQRVGDDPYNALTASLFGPLGETRAGAKLSFGDFGRYDHNGWNVFVGEYGTADTDMLWLHGKKGIYLTTGGTASQIIGYYNTLFENSFVFKCNVLAHAFKILSTENYKSEVMPIENPLGRLIELDVITYRYDCPQALNTLQYSQTDTTFGLLSEESNTRTQKEKQDSVEMRGRSLAQAKEDPHYGFVNSTLKELFPELIEEDALGEEYIDYAGFIPVIIAAMKQQQGMISYQQIQLQSFQNRLSESATSNTTDKKHVQKSSSSTFLGSEALLFQNTPNPFTSTAEIRYYIPAGSQQATLYVFNMIGTLIQSFTITSFEEGSVFVEASSLTAGMYLYTLVVDGLMVDTKQMILTQ